MRDRSTLPFAQAARNAGPAASAGRRLGAVAAGLCLLLWCGAAAGGGDAINGGFEEGTAGSLPAGWEIGKHFGQVPAGATYVVDATVSHTGSRSLHVASPGAEGIPAIVWHRVPVEPNQSYVLSASMRSDGNGADAELLAVSTDYKAVDRAAVAVTAQWRRYQLVFETGDQPAATYFLRFDLQGSGNLWIDDVAFRPLSEAAGDSAAIGYRYGKSHGERQVTLTVGEPTGQVLPNINGVCYHRGFGAPALDPRFAGLNLKVVRLHNVLSHQNILRKEPGGGFSYDYTLLDKSLDEILATGAVPAMSLCFVPVEMVENPEPGKIVHGYYLGPPSDLAQWEAYIHDLVRHCAERYPNVADWYWIFGNEPGVRQFSMGTKEQYFELYQRTVAAATRAFAQIQIGAGSFAQPRDRGLAVAAVVVGAAPLGPQQATPLVITDRGGGHVGCLGQLPDRVDARFTCRHGGRC